jgi:hypothetical protein
MKIETLIQETIDSIETLSQYVKTHQSVRADFEILDELGISVSELQEIAYELEARVPSEDEDIGEYEEL